MDEARKQRLLAFCDWVKNNISGYEKGEAQIFLDRLFIGFAQKGALDVGGTPEFKIRKDKDDGGGVAFADYVWKPIVLIEMKKRGEDLSKHYRQAFDYWVRLVPDRPHYVVLCNFDEFWVYDFNIQMDAPVDKLQINELPNRWGPLAFLFPTMERPTFRNDQEVVTRDAADRLAICFNKLIARNVDRSIAQRFTLQMLVALFAEDIGLLSKYLVANLLDDCKEPKDSFDLLGGLFLAMNTPDSTSGGRFKGVDYFNGGVFIEPVRIELYPDEINQLKKASEANWSNVRPEIFGTLFEHSLGQEERHAFGAHFTSAVDIMKIVGPTIIEPWREQIENARTLKRLNELLDRIHNFIVLDPACGSGNFLYISYRELKRLEFSLYEKINEMSGKLGIGQGAFGFVTARQFYGIDINPFAVELAKVTMMIGRKLSIDELHIDEKPLPLDNLDSNFFADDALIDELGNPAIWPRADIIIGNPPFMGAKKLKPERGPDYVNAVRKAYPEVPGMADYCVYWFRKAHDHLNECTGKDPLGGRAGLVGTQNIRNNKSREGGLDYIVKTGTIIEAVENQPWSGEANVHVSIANWAKTKDSRLLPKKCKLWYKVDSLSGTKRIKGQKGKPTHKVYDIAVRECEKINSALSDKTDVSKAKVLSCNTNPKRVFQGITPGHSGFILSASEKQRLISKDPGSAGVIFPYLIGRDLVSGKGNPSRFVIDFQQMSIMEAKSHKNAFKHIESKVLPDILAKAQDEHESESVRKAHLKQWWMLWRKRADRLEAMQTMQGYCIACSRVTKRPIFVFISDNIRPADALQTFIFDDDYSYGILQSNTHWQWFVTKCAKLCERFTYNPSSVFDTFPWPQSPSTKQIDAVSEAGRKIRNIRTEVLKNIKGGLRAVYKMLELPGKSPLKDAHAELDKATMDAYGFSNKKDLLSQLLMLNLEVFEKNDQGQTVTSPGIPPNYPEPENLITDDCISA